MMTFLDTTNVVGFPGLGLGPYTIDRVAIHNLFGLGIDIYWYAIIITCGLILAVLFGLTQAKFHGLKTDNIIDVCLFGIPAALIGARLYYVLFALDEFHSFADVINFRNGGLAIYGGIIAAFITGLIYCKVKKVNMLALYDLGGLGFFIGQMIGRWGNFINAEAYGATTTAPWGMTINGRGPYHPTFFYESFANLIGFIAIFIFFRKFQKKKGETFALYFTYYGIIRAIIEGFRLDSLYFFNLRISQILGIVFAVCGLTFFILLRVGVIDKLVQKFSKKKKEKDEEYEEVYKPLVDTIPKSFEASDEDVQRSLEEFKKYQQLSENKEVDKEVSDKEVTETQEEPEDNKNSAE